jgi:hypothetical protein
MSERLKGAGKLACIGLFAGIMAAVFFHGIKSRYELGEYELTGTVTWYLFSLGGAIAGAISGMDRSRTAAAVVGMFIAAILLGSRILHPDNTPGILSALLFSPLCALVGGYMRSCLRSWR